MNFKLIKHFLYLVNEGIKILLQTLRVLSLCFCLVFKKLAGYSKLYFFSTWTNSYFMDNFCYLYCRVQRSRLIILKSILNSEKFDLIMKKFLKLNLFVKTGLFTLVLGTGPLLVLIILDTFGIVNVPNPVGFGIISFISFWPAIILIIIGAFKQYLKKQFTI